jgi:hypothetical protein
MPRVCQRRLYWLKWSKAVPHALLNCAFCSRRQLWRRHENELTHHRLEALGEADGVVEGRRGGVPGISRGDGLELVCEA